MRQAIQIVGSLPQVVGLVFNNVSPGKTDTGVVRRLAGEDISGL